MPLSVTSAGTGELAAIGSRQLRLPEGGVVYSAVLARSVLPFQPSGFLIPTAMGSDPSVHVVLSESDNRRISSNMFGPLSDKPDGTTTNSQANSTCLPAGELPNKTPIFIKRMSDARTFLARCGIFVLAV